MGKRLRTTSSVGGRSPSCWSVHAGAAAHRRAASAAASVAAPPSAAASAAASAAPSASAAAAPSAAPAAAVPTVPTGYTELDTGIDQGRRRQVAVRTARRSSIQTQWIGGEGTNFAASVADFATATGIKIQIDSIGSSHETVLKTRIEGGKPPDIAQLAQPTPDPGLRGPGQGHRRGHRSWTPRSSAMSMPNTIGLVTQGDKIWGIPYKADVKSTIWYPIKAFAAKGYTVPTTWDELIALSDKIVADGSNPWCVSAGGPGDATGWQLTDWVEEVVLKTKGADYYNDWISHKVTVRGPGHQGRLRQGRQDLLHAELRLRHQHRDRSPGPEDDDGPDVHRRPGQPEVLDAEDPDLVRPGLLPGSAGQRHAVEVRHRRRTSASCRSRPSIRPRTMPRARPTP